MSGQPARARGRSGPGAQSQNQALEKKGNLGELQTLLDKYKQQIAVALPRHLTPERMIRIALTAVSKSPLLQRCNVLTIAGSVVQASILGLEVDGALGEGYLVPFWNTKASGYECQFMPGYQGLLKLVRNTDELITIDAQAVHAEDFFEYEYGLDPFLRHRPAEGDRGEITKYWAAATLKGGGKQFAVMTKKEIEDHRDKYSKGAYVRDRGELVMKDGRPILQGPWRDSPEWMFKKTVLRQLCKLLPKASQAQLAIALDEATTAGIPQRFSVDVPIELHPTTSDQDENQISDSMRESTQRAADDLGEKLKEGQRVRSESGKAPEAESKKKEAAGGQKRKGKGTKDAEASAGLDEAEVNEALDESLGSSEDAVPETYPEFTGEAQAQTIADSPEPEDLSTIYSLAREAGVIPSKESTKLYGISPDELSKAAVAHFTGYLGWLKQKGAEAAEASE